MCKCEQNAWVVVRGGYSDSHSCLGHLEKKNHLPISLSQIHPYFHRLVMCRPIIPLLKHTLLLAPPSFIRHTNALHEILSFSFVPQLTENPLPELLYPSAPYLSVALSISSCFNLQSIFTL